MRIAATKFLYIILIVISCFEYAEGQICVGTPGEVTWEYWRNIPDDVFGELYANEYYPDKPDGSRIINSVRTPVNFDNRFGSLIRGFIMSPQTESIQFNITGDNNVLFYLSTDQTEANLQLEAHIYGYTGSEDHDKYPEQTTRSIQLTANQYYYFEIHHVEYSGGDHASLWWKTSFTGLTNWNFVSSQYIASVGCLDSPCLERGTPCDDGNASTTDDQEDGHCNCIGVAETSNNCVGERGTVEAYYYDQIPGGNIDDLYEDPDFPAMPDRYELLDMLGILYRYEADSFGTLVQGFLTVPVTGAYQFNITSNSDAIFFLSSNDDPALKQAHQILNTSSTGSVEHDKFIYQSTGPITLQKGQYYYFELNHKESSWQEHYNIFWKTPFYAQGQWKRIPSFYLFDYSCEISCIPEGTLCDDGDPFTNDDAFDANCTCTGTPCSGPDCDDPIANYVPYPECGLTDQLDNRADASWLSCQASVSPNPAHGTKHWLQYDLGIEHKLWASHIWNYNVTGGTSEGFQSVTIDYSSDGTNWTTVGDYNWPLASGDPDYSGFMGPNFGGVRARYILITSKDNISSCRGISKMTFSTQECGEEGTSCDDGNPDTIGDVYDADCNCMGRNPTFNDCSQDSLMLGDSILTMDRYSAIMFLNTGSQVNGSSDVHFMASEEIEISPGFTGTTGAILTFEIEDCSVSHAVYNQEIVNRLKNDLKQSPLTIFSVEDSDEQWIGFYIENPSDVKLELVDTKGNVILTFLDSHLRNSGYYTKRLRTKKLPNVKYEVRLTTETDHYREALLVRS